MNLEIRIEKYDANLLKHAAARRNVSFSYDESKGEVTLNSKSFNWMGDAELYLTDIPRIDDNPDTAPMNLEKAKQQLEGTTVNIYDKPLTREDFEGAAKVKKVLSYDRVSDKAFCRVVFSDGIKTERFVTLGAKR